MRSANARAPAARWAEKAAFGSTCRLPAALQPWDLMWEEERQAVGDPKGCPSYSAASLQAGHSLAGSLHGRVEP